MSFTLVAPCQYEEIIKKSRFLTFAAPINSAEEAAAFFQQHSDPTATHNCWAWKLGQQYRFNDDGEPGGTAGRPMLSAIEGQDMDRVAVLVIRWYGGIKLGTGGLARAYGGCAAKSLQVGERTELLIRQSVSIDVLFAEHALIKSRLADYQAQVEDEQFGADGARLQLSVAPDEVDNLQRFLSDISRGRIILHRCDE